jgi:hypothetical protein
VTTAALKPRSDALLSDFIIFLLALTATAFLTYAAALAQTASFVVSATVVANCETAAGIGGTGPVSFRCSAPAAADLSFEENLPCCVRHVRYTLCRAGVCDAEFSRPSRLIELDASQAATVFARVPGERPGSSAPGEEVVVTLDE